ncbi:MAG: hypothetical protein OEM04_13195, partial [Flavobacteriaceae bacterium]|nr:hypothetical protein [Flavobacteriaceae bacterium]
MDLEIMKPNNIVFQLLGFDPNWICVIYDLIMYNHDKSFSIEVFPNISSEIKAADRLLKIPFRIREMRDIQSTQPVLFGVASGRNKYRIYKDFLPYLKDEDYENLIAKSSVVSRSNVLGSGVLIDHQCVTSAQTIIG